ncbi:MAG: hypothetical protein KDB14_15585 [Planctomycetales bacterium]|nr:hypothetical protein [Planctomycetales bacterium]
MDRIVSLGGLSVMIGLAVLLSSDRRRIPWRIVAIGVALQLALATFMLLSPPGRQLAGLVDHFFARMQSWISHGAGFLFDVNGWRDDATPPANSLASTFAFGVLPTVIFFSSLMSVLYYLGIMQRVVAAMAKVMQQVMGVSGAESLSAAANVFVGHTEAPLVIKPYIASMTRSELNAVMVGGFATISGGLMAAFVGMGINAGHLMTASVISAPAALVIAKILQPETGAPETMGSVRLKAERQGVNVIEAAAIGATEGLKLALNVGAMLIAFLAMIAMIDYLLGVAGGWLQFTGERRWTLAGGLGYLFAPLAWSMGIDWADCRGAGELLGIKMVANEFVAYSQLGEAIEGTRFSERTVTILTYALSGFSNFGAIGIQIGGIGGLAPNRQSDLAQLGLRAMLGGALACCMTACIAGALIGG